MTEWRMHACCCPGGTALDWALDALMRKLGWTGREREPEMGQTITKSAKDIVRAAREAVPELSVEEALPLGALDRAPEPIGGEAQIRIAGELSGHRLVAVDDDAGAPASHRGERVSSARDDHVAAEHQVRPPVRDAGGGDLVPQSRGPAGEAGLRGPR